MQLSSASLPVGGYSFSQGLEYAIEAGWLENESDVSRWVKVVMLESQAKTDLPILIRQYQAFLKNSITDTEYWNEYLLASRESAEFYKADVAMGKALLKLLPEFGVDLANMKILNISFVTSFALAAAHWKLGEQETCKGFLWAWLENQVIVASKLLPMGQTASQKIILHLADQIPKAIACALTITDDAIGNSLPGLAIASARHETQYSRLFCS